MRIIDTLDEMNEIARGWLTGGTVGCVLLTSRIHEGHRALLEIARQECEILVVCILDKLLIDATTYGSATLPQDIVRDLRLPNIAPIDIVFIPQEQALYPPDFSMYVTPGGSLVTQLAKVGQAAGLRKMATTITKLFQLVRPDITFCGQKDALQIATFRQIIRDLNIDMRLHIVPTVRQADGLAVSNRNQFLTPTQRQEAPILHQALKKAQILIANGIYNNASITREINAEMLHMKQIALGRIMLCHPDTLIPVPNVVPNTVLILSVRAGSVLLIDVAHWLPDGQWRF